MPHSSILARLDEDPQPQNNPNEIQSFDFQGFIIHVGRNSYSNERLVGQHPHRRCLWLHALAARGSHVVVCLEERADCPDPVVQYAAKLAIDNSHSEGRTVKVARLEKVFKPEGGGIGVWKTLQTTTIEAL